jgi:glycosyltransferase involved in cell wall biosynthesis
MRILMVAPEPIFEPRGTPLSVVGRLKAYSDMGHQVDLLTYAIGSDVHLPKVRIHRILKIPGIRNIKIGPSIQKIPLDFFLFLESFTEVSRRRYDLIHTHEEAGFWGVLLGRLFRIPHVYDMHSSLPQQLGNFQFTKSKTFVRLFEMLETWVLKYSSAVITICPDLQNQVKKQFPSQKSILIENVVDYGMVFGEEDKSRTIRKTHGLGGKKVVLYTGTFEPYQGIDFLIESAGPVIEKIPSVRFLLVGGRPEQVEFYKKMVKKRHSEFHFLFTGQVLPQEVNSYIQCADVLVSPRTKGTNTPLKIYAYLRSGVPVVATRLWTHTQVLNDRVSILTDPNPEAFGKGILKALADSRFANNIQKAAAALAEERYSYQVYLNKLDRMLVWAVGGKR